jgi:hypothetical protein
MKSGVFSLGRGGFRRAVNILSKKVDSHLISAKVAPLCVKDRKRFSGVCAGQFGKVRV